MISEKIMDKKYNTIKCLSCNAILRSKHRHDFQMCDCANKTFVDGGSDYFRSGGMDLNLIQVLNHDDNTFSSIVKANKNEAEQYSSLNDVDYDLIKNVFSCVVELVEKVFAKKYRLTFCAVDDSNKTVSSSQWSMWDDDDICDPKLGLAYCLHMKNDCKNIDDSKFYHLIYDLYTFFKERDNREDPKKVGQISNYNSFISQMCSKYSCSSEDELERINCLTNDERLEKNILIRKYEDVQREYELRDAEAMRNVIANRKRIFSLLKS